MVILILKELKMDDFAHLCLQGICHASKGVLDGGTRPGDTLQVFPLAQAQLPLYYLPLCVQGTPFTHPLRWIFQGHSVGH